MNQLTAALIVVIGILGGFYTGARYGQGHPAATTPSAATAGATGTGAGAAGSGLTGSGNSGFAGGGAAQGSATTGQIVAVSGDTITVRDRQTNKDVKVNVGSARITRTTQGTTSDLTQNETVTVVGQAGSDGTVTATAISIGGAGALGGGGGRLGRPSPSPSR